MSLTPEMFDLLIAEYFFDPMNLGYRQYGNYITNVGTLQFYIPQILGLANSPVDKIEFKMNDKTGMTDEVILRGFYPSRVSQIFEGIEGAPNFLVAQDVLEAFIYFYTIHPELAFEIEVVTE